jgi:hypothetical protein
MDLEKEKIKVNKENMNLENQTIKKVKNLEITQKKIILNQKMINQIRIQMKRMIIQNLIMIEVMKNLTHTHALMKVPMNTVKIIKILEFRKIIIVTKMEEIK